MPYDMADIQDTTDMVMWAIRTMSPEPLSVPHMLPMSEMFGTLNIKPFN